MATYNSPTDVTAGSLAKSSDLNNIDAATAAAFALLPTNATLNAGTVNFAVDTGAANAYLVALPMTATSYADGLSVVMRPLATNTGASTINVDSLGVKAVKTEANTALIAGDITAGVPVELRYSTATGFFHIIKNSAAASAAAAASAVAAAASAAAALVSQNAASGSASAASGSAAAALVSETNAETAETNAETAETNAETAETNAAISAAAALVSANNAAASYDSFDDRYLGAKASDPALDNDGNALLTGALYFNTVTNLMKVYSGSAWAALSEAVLTAGLTTQILVGGGAGVDPVWGTNLPTAVTIGSAYIYRAAGTDVPVTDGGTGVSTFALNGVLYGNAGSAIGVTAIGAEGQILRVGASPFVPAWTTATFASTYVQGSILHAATANTIAALNPGAVGSFLMSNGSSAALSYLAAGAANYCLVGAGVTTAPVWTAATGTGAPVLATSPALVTPALGTPASGTLTSCSGLPAAGVVGTALVAAAIGTTVQAYNSNLTAINQALTTTSSPSFTAVTTNVTGNCSGSSGSCTGNAATSSSCSGNAATSSSCSGNAATVTNGVYTSGDQTIGGTKTFSSTITGNISGNAGGSSASCTGNAATATTAAACSGNTAGSSGSCTGNAATSSSCSGNAATVTGGVYTSGDQTIAGTKTFSSTITGNISGNAGGSSASCTGNAATATTAAACSGNTAGSSGSCTGNAATSSSCTGNAATATKLAATKTIGGVAFDGSGNITVASATGGFAVSGGALTADHIAETTGSHGVVVDSALHVNGVATLDNKADIWWGGESLIIGADTGNFATRTDDTEKRAIFCVPSYDTAEQNVCIIRSLTGFSGVTNPLYIGGSSSDHNCVTSISFYTAENITTVTGTRRFLIASTGITCEQPLTLPGGLVTYTANDSAGAGFRYCVVPNA